MLGVGRHLSRWSFVLGGLVLAAGCGQSTLGAACRSNDDCGSDERCETSSARSEQPIFGPCPYTSCQQQGDCSNGYVCAPLSQTVVLVQPGQNCSIKICVPPCDPENAATCPASMLCRDDGSCSYLQCDEPGGITCPEHWRCDPDTAPGEPPGGVDNALYFEGTAVADAPDPENAIVHGCVRKRCTEDDGYTCDATHVCDESQLANGSGCVPGNCKELGRCSDDDLYVCEPTSTASRLPGTDENGCVMRNCEEGRACTVEPDPWHFCDPSDATADAIGCAVVPCTEGSPCPLQWVCDPNGKFPDPQGCVYDPALSAGGAGGDSGTSGTSSGGAGASNGGSGNGGDAAATGSGAQTSGGGSSATGGGANGSGGAESGGSSASGANSATGGASGTTTSGDGAGDGRCVAQ